MENAVKKTVRGLHFSKGEWVIDRKIAGQRTFLRTGTADQEAAFALYQKAIGPMVEAKEKKRELRLKLIAEKAAQTAWQKQVEEWEIDRTSWMHRTVNKMRTRGRLSGKGCSMDLSQLKLLLLESNGKCVLTGIPFNWAVPDGAKVAPYAASVDRIISAEGYHLANCRIVCVAVNMAMREWGEAVLVRIGKAMLLKELQENLQSGTGENPQNRYAISRSTKKNAAKSGAKYLISGAPGRI